MGAKRRAIRSQSLLSNEAKEKEHAQETTRLVNAILDTEEVDAKQLRKIAAVRGLVNKELRQRAWPVLLGVEDGFSAEEYENLKMGKHRDSSTVLCDVDRSLWFYTEDWSQEDRAAKRQALHAVLTAVVCKFPGDVHYYQGLHDIASVLLFNADERMAFRMLSCMARCHLRDCTRPTLDAVLELLHLLLPLLEQADKELHDHIAESGIPPFFALSWVITWFAHNVPDLGHISRIFDLLLSSHPLMPLYVAAAAMQAERGIILNSASDPAELHRVLTNLRILPRKRPGEQWVQHHRADDLAQRAILLFKRCPPIRLLRLSRLHMHSATAPEAVLLGQHYSVPQTEIGWPGRPRNALKWLSPQTGGRTAIRQATTVVFSLASLCAFSYAVYMNRAWQVASGF